MIKRLMLVVAISASFATQAAEVARVQNNDGGAIVFTTTNCDEKTFSVYGYGNSSNSTIAGCYFYKDDAFWVQWTHTTNMKRYPSNAVTWHPDFLDAMKKNTKTY